MKTIRNAAILLSVLLTALLLPHRAAAQRTGPDMLISGHVDVARNGIDTIGTTTAYSIGSVSCNHGDLPATVSAANNQLLRIHIAQNMYRLKTAPGGQYQRFEQVGQGWCKRVAGPAAGSVTSCGTCVSGPQYTMGPGCADVYSSGFNGIQGLLGPRSAINPVLGTMTSLGGNGTGDPTTRERLQVRTADLVSQPAGTRFFVEMVVMLPDDAQYVLPGQTIATNAMNNAASQEININGGTGTPTLLGGNNAQIPALVRWQMSDPAVTVVTVDDDSTPNPNPSFPNTFIRTRFYIAARVSDLGAGQWRYEYVVFNLNSDRSAGALTIPLPAHAPVTDFAFRHPLAHSGEPFSNSPWTTSHSGDRLSFVTETYAANPNANAVRWGTMYNFGFTTNVPPSIGHSELTLFKPGSPAALQIPGLPAPTVRYCSADVDGDTVVGSDQDIEAFFSCLSGNCCPLCEGSDFNADGDFATDTDIESFFRVLAGAPC
jgi:hypothetical protein